MAGIRIGHRVDGVRGVEGNAREACAGDGRVAGEINRSVFNVLAASVGAGVNFHLLHGDVDGTGACHGAGNHEKDGGGKS